MNTEPIKDAVRLCFVGEGNDDQPADIVLSRERTVGWVVANNFWDFWFKFRRIVSSEIELETAKWGLQIQSRLM
jgi:hypothetical protein